MTVDSALKQSSSSGLIADEAATGPNEVSCGGSHNLPPQWVEPRSLPASGEGDVVFEFHDPAAGRPLPMKVRYQWPRLFPFSLALRHLCLVSHAQLSFPFPHSLR
jgi:hypothetical protein